jgi:hypothetical protein
MVLPCRAVAVVHSPLAMQWIMLVNLFILVKLFYGSEVAADAMLCSGSVCTVTAGSVIAALSAASRHAGNNGGPPIAGAPATGLRRWGGIAAISKALNDDWIIATGSPCCAQNAWRVCPLRSYSATNRAASTRLWRRRAGIPTLATFIPEVHHIQKPLPRYVCSDAYDASRPVARRRKPAGGIW